MCANGTGLAECGMVAGASANFCASCSVVTRLLHPLLAAADLSHKAKTAKKQLLADLQRLQARGQGWQVVRWVVCRRS